MRDVRVNTSANGERAQCTACGRWFSLRNRTHPHCRACWPPPQQRKHPKAKVGDVFGQRRVVRLLPHDHTCNERVLARCACGKEQEAYVFNLRKSPSCAVCAAQDRLFERNEAARG